MARLLLKLTRMKKRIKTTDEPGAPGRRYKQIVFLLILQL